MEKKSNDDIKNEQFGAFLETKVWELFTNDGQKSVRRAFGEIGRDTTNSEEAKLYPVLDLDVAVDTKHITEEQKKKILECLSNSKKNGKKTERSSFKELSDMEISAILYEFAKKGIITVDFLRESCADDMNYSIGLAISKVILENLENLSTERKTDDMSGTVKCFGISKPAWLTDCLFENYMECFMKRHEYFDDGDRFMFSYKANSELEKWLEKVIISVVKRSYISPLLLIRYFGTLEDDKVFLEPEGFVSWYYEDAKYAIEQDMRIQDRYRYLCFYWCCIEDKNYVSRFDKDSFGALFLTLLANGLIADNLVADGPEHYLYNFLINPIPEEKDIQIAFSKSFADIGNWIKDWEHIAKVFPCFMNFLSERFVRPILLAIMSSKSVSLKEVESFLFSIFYGYGIGAAYGENSREKPFNTNSFSNAILGPNYFERTKERTNEEKNKLIDLVLSCVDKLSDDRKLISIVALVNPSLINFIPDNEKILQKRFGSCFDGIFDKYVRNENKIDADFYDLLNRLVIREKILGLSNDQIECAKEKISLIDKQQESKSKNKKRKKNKKGKEPKLGDDIAPEDCVIM